MAVKSGPPAKRRRRERPLPPRRPPSMTASRSVSPTSAGRPADGRDHAGRRPPARRPATQEESRTWPTADLKRLIARVEDLPTLPRTVLRITELVNDPRASAKDLARIITDDQVLTARLLKLVNSSFYGFPQRVSTVTGAIVLIGFDAIRNLLLTTSVFDLFPSRTTAGPPRPGDALGPFARHARSAPRRSARSLRHEKLEELFVAGLLHDIGKIVEMTLLPEEFARITDRASRGRGLLISAAETEVLGCTHADIGRLLAERWNLPAKLVTVIARAPHPAGGRRL
ncbi:MAG: HDOD domain-containing protein [Desulfobacterales bacterium]|nr:HDOD domain-containing protein [Desulfobacterales bacterium]